MHGDQAMIFCNFGFLVVFLCLNVLYSILGGYPLKTAMQYFISIKLGYLQDAILKKFHGHGMVTVKKRLKKNTLATCCSAQADRQTKDHLKPQKWPHYSINTSVTQSQQILYFGSATKLAFVAGLLLGALNIPWTPEPYSRPAGLINLAFIAVNDIFYSCRLYTVHGDGCMHFWAPLIVGWIDLSPSLLFGCIYICISNCQFFRHIPVEGVYRFIQSHNGHGRVGRSIIAGLVVQSLASSAHICSWARHRT